MVWHWFIDSVISFLEDLSDGGFRLRDHQVLVLISLNISIELFLGR